MVMSLSLSPEAGGQTTPAVLHSTLQDLCSMSVSKLPVWVTRKRCLFPDVFSVNHPGLTEETEPNTVGCFCIWTSLCWQWVPEFSVKTQTFTFDILEGKHTYLVSSFEVLLHLWKKLHKALSEWAAQNLILSPTDLPQVSSCILGSVVWTRQSVVLLLWFLSFFFTKNLTLL